MSIPKGYKLVPVEPTEEIIRRMLAVKWPATYRNHLRFDGDGPQTTEKTERDIAEATKQYSVAIAAAPTPPKPIYDEAKERALFEAWYKNNCALAGINAKLAACSAWLACAQSRAKSVEE